MAEELISEYIDIAAVQAQTGAFLAEIKKLDDAFEKTAKNRISFGDATSLQQSIEGSKKLQQQLDSLAKSVAGVKKANDEVFASSSKAANARAAEAKAAQAEAKAVESSAKAKIAESKASREAEASKKRETKFAADLTDDYMQLSRAYNDAAKRAKNYALQLGESHPVTQEAIKDAKQMYDTLYRIDQTVGQNQRNVGNYKSAFDGLGQSFAQVSRELPSLTISAQQFFLAISNNLPMVFDEMKRAKSEIAALKAQGQETQSLMSRIGQSLFSWQVFLSIGITLLVAYGKQLTDYIGGLFKTTEALDKTKKGQELLTSTMESSSGAYQKAVTLVNELQTNITLAKQGFLDKDKVLKQYNDTIGKTTGEVKNLDEAEQALVKNGDAYIKMSLLKAAAQLALDQAAAKAFEAEQVRRKKASEFVSGTDFAFSNTGGSAEVFKKQEAEREKLAKQRREAEAKRVDDDKKAFIDIAQQFQKDAAQIAKSFNFDFFGGEQDEKSGRDKSEKNAQFFAEELKDRAERLKEYSKIEILSIKTRQEARKEAAAVELDIIAQERAVAVANAKGDSDQVAQFDQEAAFKRKLIARNLESDLTDIGRSYQATRRKQQEQERADAVQAQKDLGDQEKAAIDKRFKALADANEKAQTELAKARDILLTDLENKRNGGLISDKEYNKRRLEIEQEFAKAALKVEIDLAEDIIALRKALGFDVAEAEKILAGLKLKFAREESDARKTKQQEEYAETEAHIGKIRAIYSEVYSFASGLYSAMIDRQKNELQGQIDQLEERKQKEIEVANASIRNEQDKAAAILVINARADAQREILERRQRELDLRRARFEKAAGIARIIIETAQAVVHQLASGDVLTATARALAAGAIGAGRLAVAIATPLPQFKHGRKDGPATMAVVGDGGVSEVVASKDMKHAYITPATDTLTYLNKGDRVFPSVEEFQQKATELSYRPVMASRESSFDEEKLAAILTKGYAMQTDHLARAIKNKKEIHIKGSHAGVMAIHKMAQSHWTYIDQQINF